MVSAVQIGSEVQTAGGIVGRVVDMDDQYVQLQVGPGTTITFVRTAVARVLSSGTAPMADGSHDMTGDGSHVVDLSSGTEPDSPGDEGAEAQDEPAGSSSPWPAPSDDTRFHFLGRNESDDHAAPADRPTSGDSVGGASGVETPAAGDEPEGGPLAS